MHFSVANAGIAKGIKDSQKKRAADEQQDVENRRGKHGGAQCGALGRADGRYFFAGYCHDTVLGAMRFSEERSKNFR
jgi:hypothetical protein